MMVDHDMYDRVGSESKDGGRIGPMKKSSWGAILRPSM